jgi:hypothetical protein
MLLFGKSLTPTQEASTMSGIANIHRRPARNEQLQKVTRARPGSIVQRRVAMAALWMRHRKSQVEH